jgi:hypothetical protein
MRPEYKTDLITSATSQETFVNMVVNLRTNETK